MDAAIFTVRIFKNIVGRGAVGVWSNTYHILTAVELGSARMAEFIDGIVSAERFTHINNVEFLRAVVSTTKEDPNIQDGSNVRSIGLAGVGAQIEPSGGGVIHTQLPAEAVLVIAHGTTLGRQGANSYRHCIRTGDWQSNQGAIEYNQNQADTIEGRWNQLVTVFGPIGVLNNSDNVNLVIAKPQKLNGVPTGLIISRPITKFDVIGVRNRQLGRRRSKKKIAAPGVI